ncbi:hypothetical protein [Cronobacter dublinensis]|uniref:hypothetical protein n=1 Tax=Cronobacter dublinensis TaxID=413497 RepID=UPI000CFAC5C8|nr:hypothetical protein [Cronobacter dublinensis]MDT3604375.1 hypothetical protein [Cronobacter dublinensis]
MRQIYRLIATGFSLAEVRAFPDCILLDADATFCPPTKPVQYQCLKELKPQISVPEQRKARLLETLCQYRDNDALK